MSRFELEWNEFWFEDQLLRYTAKVGSTVYQIFVPDDSLDYTWSVNGSLKGKGTLRQCEIEANEHNKKRMKKL